jgi:3-hydroxy-9,10-secoandrosta-1,3,5(10)-triene-9,17-dione monooxygenase reductase component
LRRHIILLDASTCGNYDEITMADLFEDAATGPVDPDRLRQAMRLWATGVAVVTSQHEGVVHGMTVSSFTSVSLTPPQVLIALAQSTRTHGLVKNSRYFGISVLSAGQVEISDRFAGRPPEDVNRLDGLETFTLVSGIPLLKNGVAHFDCRVIATFTSGTHTIFIGSVLAAQGDLHGEPLLYFNRKYQKLGPL